MFHDSVGSAPSRSSAVGRSNASGTRCIFPRLNPAIPFGWYVIFALIFIGFAFFAQKGEQLPWAVSAVSGALHFWLIYEIVFAVYPQLQNGFLPALFIVPYAFGVFYLIKKQGVDPASGDARLAWQGGAALSIR